MPWLELVAILLLAAAGCWLGRRIGRTRRWWLGFIIPLVFVLLVFLGHRSVTLSFIPPISWAVDADFDPLLMALAITLMLSALIVRLPARRFMPSLLMAIMVAYYSILPIAAPLAARTSLATTPTHLDSHGVCRQQHGYSCGPAAAVTCLRALGISADEGSIAIEARCGPLVGADGPLLASAITHMYATQGIHCAYRLIPSLDTLPLPAIANMSMPTIGGHYVAVLEVHPDSVLVADPLGGLYGMSRTDFLAQWKDAAHVFRLVTPHPDRPAPAPAPRP